MASTAASSTSALFLIRPKKGRKRRRNQLKFKLQHKRSLFFQTQFSMEVAKLKLSIWIFFNILLLQAVLIKMTESDTKRNYQYEFVFLT